MSDAIYLVGLMVTAWLAVMVLTRGGQRQWGARTGRVGVTSEVFAGSPSILELQVQLDRLLRRLPIVESMQESLSQRSQRAMVLRELPQLLDIATLGLLSGLSFDAALELYCDRYKTHTARLFREALTSWRLGLCSREEALSDLAGRVGVSALSRFSSVVSQALHFGSPLALALERQAQAIRDEQRSQVEEEIERAPVRMLIPLGTLVVPAMLLAILGPLLGSSLVLG